MALDEDGDASNGIQISEVRAEEAKNWEQLDFSSTQFESDVANIDTDIDLPTSLAAKEHIEATYRCMYSGLWIGEYGSNGVDEGEIIKYSAIDSVGSNSATYSTVWPGYQFSSSSSHVSYQNDVLNIDGDVSGGSYFKVEFPSISEARGSWQLNNGPVGTISGNRFNKDLAYQNRITAAVSGTETGYSQNTNYYVAVDIKDSGEYKVAVQAFNEELSGVILYPSIPEVSKRISEIYQGSGTLDAGSAVLSLAGINRKIKIDTDLATNTVSLLSDSDTVIDTVSGSSCKLL